MPNRLTKGRGLFGSINVPAAGLRIADDPVDATAAELDRAADASARIVALAAATLTVTEALHDGKVIVVDRAAGSTLTLPAATGSGTKIHVVVKTTITSTNLIIQVVGDDTMTGIAQIAQDAADTIVAFETAADSDTITMNGSTKGGIKGDSIELIDIAADLWWVRVMASGTGTEATPFSAAVV